MGSITLQRLLAPLRPSFPQPVALMFLTVPSIAVTCERDFGVGRVSFKPKYGAFSGNFVRHSRHDNVGGNSRAEESGSNTAIVAVRSVGGGRMQCGLSEASTGAIHLAGPASQAVLLPKDDRVRRMREGSALQPYPRRECGGEGQPDASASAAWALRSIQSDGLASAKPLLKQILKPSATNLSLTLRVHDRRSGRVGTSYPANLCRSGGDHHQARTAAVADVRSGPMHANEMNSSALFLPTPWQAPSLANG
jgi:hypothetical protein